MKLPKGARGQHANIETWVPSRRSGKDVARSLILASMLPRPESMQDIGPVTEEQLAWLERDPVSCFASLQASMIDQDKQDLR